MGAKTEVHWLDNAKVLAIYRFPIKGLAGDKLDRADVAPGLGVIGDRKIGLSNNTMRLPDQPGWVKNSAFLQLSRNPYLAKSSPKIVREIMTVAGSDDPEVETLTVSSISGRMLSQLHDQSVHELGYAGPKVGLWDHRDAEISLINVATVNAISKRIDKSLDVARFRGNLIVDLGKPWIEFDLLGNELSIGDARIEVLRPTNRCAAISVDPKTAMRDINLPHALASNFGHVYCGLYCRVRKAGQITVGAKVKVERKSDTALSASVANKSSPTTENWPRFATVVECKAETNEVKSFALSDPLWEFVNYAKPAAFINLHISTPLGATYRSYTVSGIDMKSGELTISVKNEAKENAVSTTLHEDLEPGAKVCISGPFTDPSLTWKPSSTQPVIIATAGIGITMAASILQQIREQAPETEIYLFHGARNAATLALWSMVQEAHQDLKKLQTRLFFDEAPKDECDQHDATPGRMTLDSLDAVTNVEFAQAFVCGPPPFNRALQGQLKALGLRASAIHTDVFVSPSKSSGQLRKPSCKGPFPVDFLGHNASATWRDSSSTLLELADDIGITLPSSCRSGACRACLQPLEGDFEHLLDLPAPAPDGWAYLCCAAPKGPVKVGKQSSLNRAGFPGG